MRIITQRLNKNQLSMMIDYIVDFFQEHNHKEIIVYFGWDCNTGNMYKDIKISVDKIKEFIEKSRKKNIFILGKSDLYLSTLSENIEFQLCHEGDVHFSSKNRKFAEKVIKDWAKYKPYESIK